MSDTKSSNGKANHKKRNLVIATVIFISFVSVWTYGYYGFPDYCYKNDAKIQKLVNDYYAGTSVLSAKEVMSELKEFDKSCPNAIDWEKTKQLSPELFVEGT